MHAYLKALAANAALALVATAAQAAPTTYDCDMNSLEGRGFIQDRIIFTIDPEANKAIVVDPIVMNVYKKPIPATLQTLSNGQYRIKWDVKNLKSGATSFNLTYTLQYRPNDKAFNIRAQVRGYDNRPFGSGTCKPAPGESLPG